MRTDWKCIWPAGRRINLLLSSGLFFLFIPALLRSPTRADSDPWDGPAFSSDPGVLLHAAAAVPVPEGAPVIILFDDRLILFDAEGRETETRRIVFRVATPAGARDWAALQAAWEPWHEQRPEIRARVITPDLAVRNLEPSTIGEAPAQSEGLDVLTDRKVLQAPLPAMEVGSVVEEEIITRDYAPLFAGGVASRISMLEPAPTKRWRVAIEAPISLPLHALTRLLRGEPQRSEHEGRVTIEVEGSAEALAAIPPELLPGEVPAGPEVSYATGKSWQDVAARYGTLIDAQVSRSDLSALVRSTAPKGKPRGETIAALVAKLHKDVRYTGVEFGDAALVPRSPAETLERKYGDCKDKATLLVAMLRAAGIPAYLALLSTAPGRDIEPDLPGIGLFDHAVVYVPGSPEIWIDATAEFTRTGLLPWQDQGRYALILTSNSHTLVRTPETNSHENRTVETREFFLSEVGAARVAETSESWGEEDEYYRESFGDGDPEKIRGNLEEYVRKVYLADALAKFEYADARDFSKPYRIYVEAVKAQRATTDWNEATVAILRSPLTRRLPSYFTEEDESAPSGESTPAKEEDFAGSKAEKARDADFVLPFPYSYELHYRIVPPPGFKVQPLPESGTELWGPAQLSREFAVTPDGVVTANFKFDTIKRRLTPAEAGALRAGVRRLTNEDPIIIHFQQVGQALLGAGKFREALSEFRSLAALHPKEELHHRQISAALLAAGIGEGARDEARLAVQLEPSSAEAYRNLGWVLDRDLVGREFQMGMDHDGALAAYRKATELDPTNDWLRGQYAIALEYNSRGVRDASDAPLDEAVRQYKLISDQALRRYFPNNLAYALLYTHRFAELIDVAGSLDNSTARQEFSLVARAGTDGPAAAIEQAVRDIPDAEARRTALLGAGNLLAKVRMYSQAADLLAQGAQGSSDAVAVLTRAEILHHAQPHEKIEYPDDDPRTPVKKFLGVAFGAEMADDAFLSLFSTGYQALLPKANGKVDRSSLLMRRRNAIKYGVLPVVAVDVAMAGLQLTVQGNETSGYLVHFEAPEPMGSVGTYRGSAYVVREGGRYRIDGLFSTLADLGAQALNFAQKGDLTNARRLLDWARGIVTRGDSDDAYSGSPFARVWTAGQQGDRDTIRFAAACLMDQGVPAERSVPILIEAREKTIVNDSRKALDVALAYRYFHLHRDVEALAVSEGLRMSNPESPRALNFSCLILFRLKRWSDCEQAAEERLKLFPDDIEALHDLAFSEQGQLHWEASENYWQRILASGKATPVSWNNAAWNALMGGHITPETIQQAQRAAILSQNHDANILQTLAAVYAEAGKTTEAHAVLVQAMDVAALAEPSPAYWYVFGRLAEQIGEKGAAIADYRKVTPPDDPVQLPVSSYTLAQRRLAVLARNNQ
jgi:tetratricopeptide (TPR) repeat protein